MKTGWIDLTTAAEILGVTTYDAKVILATGTLVAWKPKPIEIAQGRVIGGRLYDREHVEELAKIRKAGKP